MAENRRLRQDIASLSARTRTMTAALLAIRPRAEDITPEPIVVGVFGQGQTVAQIVTAAQTSEALGDVPAIRFLRDAENEIVGLELAAIPSVDPIDDGAFDPTFRVLALLASEGVAN
jgi:hypothetical protein